MDLGPVDGFVAYLALIFHTRNFLAAPQYSSCIGL